MTNCACGHEDCEIDLLQELMNRLGADVWPALRALEHLPEATPEHIIAMADILDVSPTVLLALRGYVLARDGSVSDVTRPLKWKRQPVYHRVGGGVPAHLGAVDPNDKDQLLALGIRRTVLPDDRGELSKLGERPAVELGSR